MAYQLLGYKLLGDNVRKYKTNKGNKIAGTVGSVLATYMESKINLSFSELVKLLENINLNERLLVFDDLERCSLPLDEVLGFINSLVEHNHIKVLIVANVGFSKKILDGAMGFMKKNIQDSPEYISLGYRIIDSLNKEEKEEYEVLKKQLTETVENHNNLINQNGTHSVKNKQKGELGKYIYNWCFEHKTDFYNKKKFLNEVGIDNIVYIVENGNVSDVRFLIYLFNEIYNYANVKELYPNDSNDLNKLIIELKKIDIKRFNKMKMYTIDSLIKDVTKFIDKLK